MINKLQKQIEILQADVKAQREEIRRTDNNRGGVPSPMVAVVAANEERIAALKKQIEDTKQAEKERENYLASPEAKRDLKILEEKTAHLLELNKKYCAEGEALYQKILAMHQLDAEIQEMRRKLQADTGLLMGRGEFTELDHLEKGLRKAAEVGRFVVNLRRLQKNK